MTSPLLIVSGHASTLRGPIPACPRCRLHPDSWRSDREVGLLFLPVPLPPGFGLGVEISCRVYRPRDPRKTALFGLLDSLYERVKGAWEELFEPSYGFWRGLVDEVVARYLDCGIWQSGFASGSHEVVYAHKGGHDEPKQTEGESIDAMGFVARVLVQIPDPRRHSVRCYG